MNIIDKLILLNSIKKNIKSSLEHIGQNPDDDMSRYASMIEVPVYWFSGYFIPAPDIVEMNDGKAMFWKAGKCIFDENNEHRFKKYLDGELDNIGMFLETSSSEIKYKTCDDYPIRYGEQYWNNAGHAADIDYVTGNPTGPLDDSKCTMNHWVPVDEKATAINYLDYSLTNKQIVWKYLPNLESVKEIVCRPNMANTLMCLQCEDLSDLTIDLEGVTSIKEMFLKSNIKKAPKFINCDKLTDITGLFQTCENLTDVDLEPLFKGDIQKVTCLFKECKSIKNVDLTPLANKTKITALDTLLQWMVSLESVDLTPLGNLVNVNSFQSFMEGDKLIKEIDLSWLSNLNNVTTFQYAFSGCSGLTEVVLPHLNISKTVNLGVMFNGCTSLERIDFNDLVPSKVGSFDRIFTGCTSLKTIRCTAELKEKLLTLSSSAFPTAGSVEWEIID